MNIGSRIGYNIHAQTLKNHDRLIDHLRITRPAAVLVLDGAGFAKEIKAVSPDTMVIIREYGDKGDDSLHLQLSPEQFLEQRAHLSEGGKFWLYTTNEPGFDSIIFAWHVRLMELVIKLPADQRPRLVIGNIAVGVPRGNDPIGAWAEARRMLELLDQYREWFVLGLHEYGGGVMTSGLVGGAPDHPAHPNYIIPSNWPQSIYSPQKLTAFHCGRFNFLVEYCKRAGIKPPRVILTEHAVDDLSDISDWLHRLRVTPPYANIRGWKTLTEQWLAWYGGSQGWSPERAYFEQLKWANEAIYKDSIVEAQCIFSWGHSSDMWEQFDIAGAGELQTHLEKYATPLPPPTPTPEPPPTPQTQLYRIPCQFTVTATDEATARALVQTVAQAIEVIQNSADEVKLTFGGEG